MRSSTSKIWLALVVLLSLVVAGYALYAYGFLPLGATVAPPMRTAFEAHRVRVLVHIFGSILALVVGPVQLVTGGRRRTKVHRVLGYVYFGSVLVGGTSGLLTALVATGGIASRVGFALLAIAWLLTALAALRAVKRRDFRGHRVWAMRSFALTFAAVTLRVYLGLFFAAGVAFDAFYPVLGWLSWVPNLMVVEWFILPRLESNPDARLRACGDNPQFDSGAAAVRR